MSKDLRHGLTFEAIGYILLILPESILFYANPFVLGIIPVFFVFIGIGSYLTGATIIWLSDEHLKRKLIATIIPILFLIPLEYLLIQLLSAMEKGF
jgi:hypothetical protein